MVQGMAAHGPSSESVIEISATALTPPTNPPEKVRHESVMQLLALAAVQYIVMNWSFLQLLDVQSKVLRCMNWNERSHIIEGIGLELQNSKHMHNM